MNQNVLIPTANFFFFHEAEREREREELIMDTDQAGLNCEYSGTVEP